VLSGRRLCAVSLAASAALSLALAACSSSSSQKASTSSSSSGSYSWGVDAELSGEISYYGQSLANGVAAYVSSVNAAGGINGHKIKLTTLDNAGDPSQTAAVATQLITTDNVDAIFGPTLSAGCAAAGPVIERYKVPMSCFSSPAASPYVFYLGSTDGGLAAPTLIQVAKKVTSSSQLTAATVYLDVPSGIALGGALSTSAAAAGVKIVSSQAVSETATDYSVQIAKIVAAKPDVVLIDETGPGLLAILKGVRAAGDQVPFVWQDGTGNTGLLSTSTYSGLYILNDYKLIPASGATSAAAAFLSAMQSKLGKNPTAATINGGEAVDSYLTASAFGKALKACGYPCSGAQLTKAVEAVKLSLPDLDASFGYTASDHFPYRLWYVYHVVGPATTLIETVPTG
jgi:branched-chain amino acid transport system substrate-binding protein